MAKCSMKFNGISPHLPLSRVSCERKVGVGVVRGKINGDMKVIRNSEALKEEEVVKWLNPRYTRPLLSFTFH